MDALPDMVLISTQTSLANPDNHQMREVYANRRTKEFFGGLVNQESVDNEESKMKGNLGRG